MTTTVTTKQISKYSIIATILLVLVLAISLSIIIAKNKRLKEINQLYITAQDSIKISYNKLGQQSAEISVLTATHEKDFLNLQTKDADIKHLQDVIVKESKGRKDIEAAMVLANQTITKLEDKLKNQVIGDTTIGDSIYPTYKREYRTKWNYGSVILGRSYFQLKDTVVNEFEWVYGQEPYGGWPKNWFVKKEYAKITNLNPNTQTTTMKVYHQKAVANKTVKHFGEGTIVGAATMIVLHFFLK